MLAADAPRRNAVIPYRQEEKGKCAIYKVFMSGCTRKSTLVHHHFARAHFGFCYEKQQTLSSKPHLQFLSSPPPRVKKKKIFFFNFALQLISHTLLLLYPCRGVCPAEEKGQRITLLLSALE